MVGAEIALQLARAVAPESQFPRFSLLQVALPVAFTVVILSATFDRLAMRKRQVESRKTQLEHELLKSQLEALQARVNPHFLFNSLNTVATLIAEDPKHAERSVLQLASLLRYTLEASRKKQVRLADEIEAVEQYLAFARLRFEDRLETEIDVDETAQGVPVPPLILQPLVENAVSHGVAARKGGGIVRVGVKRRDDELHLTVEDDGPGPEGSSHSGTGTAEADLKQRLRLLYGARAKFSTGRGKLGGFVVRVTIPAEMTS